MADAQIGEILAFIGIKNSFGLFLDDPFIIFGALLDKKLADFKLGSARKNAPADPH